MIESSDLEEAIIGVLLTNSKYMEQLVIDERIFQNPKAKKTIELLKKQYQEYKTTDLVGLTSAYPDYFTGTGAILSMEFIAECLTKGVASQFEYYQDCLFKIHIKRLLLYQIDKFKNNQLNEEELLNSIHELEQKSLYKNSTALTGEQIYNLITQQKKKIIFNYEKLTNSANIK